MLRERLTPEQRKKQLLASAVKIAKKSGYMKVTRVAIAADTGTSEGLINRYFGGKAGLRKAIMRHAIATNDACLLSQGFENGDASVKRHMRGTAE